MQHPSLVERGCYSQITKVVQLANAHTAFEVDGEGGRRSRMEGIWA